MPKVKIPRKSTLVDMTAMVDMGFLLVTFFMLATKFKPDEPVVVDPPSSTAQLIPPEKDLIMITISKEGKVFLSMDNEKQKEELVERVLTGAHKIPLDAEEKKILGHTSSFGMPINKVKGWLALTAEERKDQEGIPCDSTGGEFFEWIYNARKLNSKANVCIKADGNTDYPVIRHVINTLTNNQVNMYKFYLITDLEESRMK